MGVVLVVEDEDHISRLIEVIIKKQGHKAIRAKSAEDALKKLSKTDKSEETPHLVLLDIMLSGMDGLQALKAIKSDPKTHQIPVIMLSALSQENVVLQGIKLGAKGYLTKPFHPKELVSRMSAFLN